MYEVFEKLCESRNVTPYKVSKETGVSRSTLSDWKKGRSRPKLDKLQLIADYFGVPLDAFTKEGGQHFRTIDLFKRPETDELALRKIFNDALNAAISQNDAVLSPEETDLLQAFRKLSRPEQIMVLRSVGVEIKKDPSESLTEAG